MPTWLFSKGTFLFVVITGLIVGATFVEYHIYKAGIDSAIGKQAEAQVKQDVKIHRTYNAIDQETPYSADKRVAIKWLCQYTTSN